MVGTVVLDTSPVGLPIPFNFYRVGYLSCWIPTMLDTNHVEGEIGKLVG